MEQNLSSPMKRRKYDLFFEPFKKYFTYIIIFVVLAGFFYKQQSKFLYVLGCLTFVGVVIVLLSLLTFNYKKMINEEKNILIEKMRLKKISEDEKSSREIEFQNIFMESSDICLIIDKNTDEILNINNYAKNELYLNDIDVKGKKIETLLYNNEDSYVYEKMKKNINENHSNDISNIYNLKIKNKFNTIINTKARIFELKIKGIEKLLLIMKNIYKINEKEKYSLLLSDIQKILIKNNDDKLIEKSIEFLRNNILINDEITIIEVDNNKFKLNGDFLNFDVADVNYLKSLCPFYGSVKDDSILNKYFENNDNIILINLKTETNFYGLLMIKMNKDKNWSLEDYLFFVNFANNLSLYIKNKKNEKKIKQYIEKYRNILNNISDIFFECDEDLNILFLSDNAYKIFGYDLDKYINKNLNDFLIEDNNFGKKILNVIDNNRSFFYDQPIKKIIEHRDSKNNKKIYELIIKYFYNDKKIKNVYGLIRDITEENNSFIERKLKIQHAKSVTLAKLNALIN